MSSFNILHISDLHWGHPGIAPRWRFFRDLFVDDVRDVQKKTNGKIDLILFSGDLVQKGEQKEYIGLKKEIDGLKSDLKLDSCPLIAVPGNHDLVRPNRNDPHNIELKRRWREDREKLLGSSDGISQINSMFKNYASWWKKHKATQKNLRINPGLLTGDFSTTVQNEQGFTLGVVGLNTAFLQTSDADEKGHLGLSFLQFEKVIPKGLSPSAWINKCDALVLMTHHPVDWLDDTSLDEYYEYMHQPGQLAMHLFGHMHEHVSSSNRRAGHHERHFVQASSLFGLEKFVGLGKQEIVRKNGYSVIQLQMDNLTKDVHYRQWPRLSFRDSSTVRKIAKHYGEGGYPLEQDEGTGPILCRPSQENDVGKIVSSSEIEGFELRQYTDSIANHILRLNIVPHNVFIRDLLNFICNATQRILGLSEPVMANFMKPVKFTKPSQVKWKTDFVFNENGVGYRFILVPCGVSDNCLQAFGGYSLPVPISIDHALPGAPSAFIKNEPEFVDCARTVCGSKVPKEIAEKVGATLLTSGYAYLMSIPMPRSKGRELFPGVINIEFRRSPNLHKKLEPKAREDLCSFLYPLIFLIGKIEVDISKIATIR